MAGAKKKPKAKSGKKTKKAKKENQNLPPLTNENYEELIVNLNQELAAQRSESSKIWDARCDAEEKFADKKLFYEDVIQSVNNDIEAEDEDMRQLNEELNKWNDLIKEQDEYFDSIISPMKEENERIKKQHQDILYHERTTLKILDNVRQEREAYLEREEMLSKEEESQDERHKLLLYEAEKLHIITNDKMQREKDKNLQMIQDYVASTRERMFNSDAQAKFGRKLEFQISQHGERYLQLIKEVDTLKAVEVERETELKVMNEVMELVKRPKRMTVKQEIMKSKSVKFAIVETIGTNTDVEKVPLPSEHFELIMHLQNLVKEAYELELKCEVKKDLDAITIITEDDQSLFVDEEEEIFALQELLLEGMLLMVSDFLIKALTPVAKTTGSKIPSCRFKTCRGHMELNRQELMRNWRKTNSDERKKLMAEARPFYLRCDETD